MKKAILMVTGFCLFIGILTIAIFVAGAILGVVLAVLVPIGLLFTAVGLVWLVTKDDDPESDNETK